MRIAVWHNLPSGGGKRALRDHVEGLIARGHSLDAWTTTTATRDFLPLDELIQERVVALDLPPTGGIARLTGKSRQIAAFRSHCREVAAQIDAGGYDVVLAHSSMGIHCPPLARFTKTPSLLYVHEPNRPLYEMTEARPARGAFLELLAERGRQILRDAERENAQAFTRVASNSAFTRESLLRAMDVDSRVCPPGVDVRRFVPKPRWESGPLYAVGVGSIQPRKNIEFILESLARIEDPARRALLWVGNSPSGAYRERLERLARERGVTFALESDVTDERVLEVLQNAFAFVYAPRLEPLGLAPLEAMACGIPVVAVAEGGCRETVQEGGILVPNDPSLFAAALESLYDDPAAAARLGRQGREWVDAEWTVDRAAERLERHLQAVARS